MAQVSEEERLKKIIDATKQCLTPLVTKPELLEKYLPKPPYAYLQMIIREVIEKTGFAEGLFTPDELNEKLKREKEEKMEFLKKIINCVILTMRKNLPVKPMKIAAGLEPDKTNLFLRMLGECAKNKDKYEWQKVVARIKSGKYTDVTEKQPEKKDGSAQPKAQTGGETATTDGPNTTGEAKRDENPPSSSQSQRSRSNSGSQRPNSGAQQQSQRQPSADVTKSRPTSSRPGSGIPDTRAKNEPDEDSGDEGEKNGGTDREDYSQAMTQRDSSMLQRPSTARPAPPKLKNNVRTVSDENDRVGSASRVGSARREKPDTTESASYVITNDQNEEEDDGIIIENTAITSGTGSKTARGDANGDQQTGFLVDQLKQQQKQMESNVTQQNSNPIKQQKRTGIILKTSSVKSSSGINGSANGVLSTGNMQSEIAKLRSTIQTLCTKTHPLGKTMDYIQEDLDSMQRELEQWKKETVAQQEKLVREKEKTEEELKHLRVNLSHVDIKTEQVLEKIRQTKANILRGDMKLEKLLRNVVSQV